MRSKFIALLMMLGLAATVGACSSETTDGGEPMQEPAAVEETAPGEIDETDTPEGEAAPEGGEG